MLNKNKMNLGEVFKAPGKLILSGEYFVLYKMPAIVFTIEEFTTTTAYTISKDLIIIELKDYHLMESFLQHSLNLRYLFLQDKYNKFLSKSLPINKVVECPMDLCCFLVGYVFDKFKMRNGIKLSIKSTIPIGVGFGSSSALIVSLLKSLNSLFNMNLTQEEFYKVAVKAENLIHGNSSGIDIQASMIGGCNYFCEDVVPIDLNKFEFFSIFTGKPETSTGESIERVRELLKVSSRLQIFKNVVLELKTALENKNLLKTMVQIKKNHFLLKELGVVPKRVQNFIKEVEFSGGAAKICGSGAVTGDNAGIVISMGDFSCISKIAQRFGYSINKIKQSSAGVYAL